MTNAKQVVSGVLLIDKPQGMTSQQVVSKVKYLLKSPAHDSKKAGHTGTLDPMATGLLPICLGDATRFAGFGLDADKGYHAIIRLGQKTDTADQDGQVTETLPVPAFDDKILANLAKTFLGKQSQIPPMYSALKKDGKKLYELARDGIHVEREARPIVIHDIRLTKLSDTDVALSVVCSKGTYVRVLGEDIAHALGTVGHLVALRRTATGGFDVAQAITLSAFEALSLEERLGRLGGVDMLVQHLPKLDVPTNEHAKRLCLGQRLNSRQITPHFTQTGLIRLYHAGVFLGLGEIEAGGRLQPKKLCQHIPAIEK